MRVDGDRRLAEGRVQDHVRRLASHAGEARQRLHAGGHLAAVLLDEGMRHAEQCLGLLAEAAM